MTTNRIYDAKSVILVLQTHFMAARCNLLRLYINSLGVNVFSMYCIRAIAHTFAAFQTEGKLYLILEFLRGGDLFTRLSKEVCIDIMKFKKRLKQIKNSNKSRTGVTRACVYSSMKNLKSICGIW